MLSRSILNWLVLLLTLATVTKSEHYHIVPVDSTDSCRDYRNGTCFTLGQLVQTDLLSGGKNLTLSFLPGDHVLTEQLLIRNFSHVHVTSQNESTAVVGLHSNGTIRFVNTTELNIEHLGFVGAKVDSHQGLIIDGAYDVYINHCYFMNLELLNQAETYIVKIANTQTATIENTLFMNNTGQALHVEADDVNITNSEFTRNNGAAVYIQSNNSLINNTEFNYNSAAKGAAVEVVSGTLVITWCNFTNNKAFQSGGAISVDSGSVSISNSELTNNSAAVFGGAILVASGSVSISNSTLTNNRADYNGGVIYGYSGSSVIISDSELTNNNAGYGGVIDILQRSTLIINNSNITNNTVISLNIFQSNVTFTGINIVSNNNGPVSAFNSRIEFNGPTTLSNNHGVFGGAISVDQSQMYINTEGVIITNNTATSGGAIFLRESTLFVNEPIEIYHNTAHQDGGGIYAYSSRVEFLSHAHGNPLSPNKQSKIAHNIAENGGGIYAVATTIKLTQSFVNIDTNTATANGSGVYLQQNSKLYLFKEYHENLSKPRSQSYYVKLMINNNSAQYGGGIFVADDTQRSACNGVATETQTILFADCFIQTIKLYEYSYLCNSNYFNTFVTNNTAIQSGADIYGGLLDRCTADKNAEYQISLNGSSSDYLKNTVKFSSISSRPVQVNLCNNSQSDYISTRKGHTFKISVMAVDQVGNPLNATIRSSVITESGVGRLKEGQAKQEVGNQCTELEYNVFSQDSSAQVELYAVGPCINLGISRQLINIYFVPCTCSFGLKPIQSDIECKCDCDPVLQRRYQITNCSEENGTIKLESDNIWIEFINTTNETGYVVSNCVFDYCVEKPVNISLSNPDEQCACNRSGVLCGECEPGLSLVLATSRCERCSDIYLLLLIPFALAGILLVALILTLNITIATGTIHGLIFYANILAANRAIFLPNLSNFLTVFVSWVNLDLGIETCFYNDMNSQTKVLLQLVFPAYMLLLMLLIIILSKYFDSFAKLLSNRNPVAALGTLVLLSYSKLLQFIIAALQYRVLDYPGSSTKTVWLYNGNVQYFTPKHIPRFVAAIIILIVCGLFTLLLFFGQWLPHCSKVMKWTKNTKYIGFMDAYHAPFTPKHRYWVGLLLFALIVHNVVVSMAPDTSLPILSSGVLSVGLIVWPKLLNNRLYKSTFCGSLESLYLFNVAILAFGTFFVKDTKTDQSALANTSMAISFTLFVTTLCYHFYQFVLKKSNTWLKIEKNLRNLGGFADRGANNGREIYHPVVNENSDVDDYEPVDPPYIDGAVEEAGPDRYITPPIIRPATRPEQLRLSYMDELAPLTTKDYRPAPPSPRVKRRPVNITHTEIGPIRDEG